MTRLIFSSDVDYKQQKPMNWPETLAKPTRRLSANNERQRVSISEECLGMPLWWQEDNGMLVLDVVSHVHTEKYS